MKRAFTAMVILGTAFEAIAAPEDELHPPEVTNRVEAIAPADALAPGEDRLVVLGVTVDPDGKVIAVDVVQSGGAVLDTVAEESVRRWSFRPAQRGSKVIAARIKVGIAFSGPPAPASQPEPTTEPASTPSSSPATEPAAATEPASEPATQPDSEPTLNATVRGRARPRSRGASDYVQVVGKLAEVPRKNATELLKLAPGFLLTNEGGEGHAEQIFLRGFDAREGQDIEISVDGVVVNEVGNLHGNGYADLHFVLPELVESVRVVEGPFDPRQGNFAVAGSADYELGLRTRGITAKVGLGSFGTERLALLWGPPGQSTHTFAGAELYQTDGFGQNRDARRATAQGQYEGRLGDDGTFRFGTHFYTSSYHSAGVIREDDYESGAKGFYDTYDSLQGGETTRVSVNADVEIKKDDVTNHHQLFFVWSTLQLRENFTGFLQDTQEAIQQPHDQRGDLLNLENQGFTFGGRGFVRKRATILGHAQEIELGYFARIDRVDATEYRYRAGSGSGNGADSADNRRPYLLETDLSSILGDVGLYGDGNLKIFDWLTLRGGLRADLFTYNVFDHCAVHGVAHPSPTHPPGDDSCLDQQDFGKHREPAQQATASGAALMPRGSVLVGPFRGITFSASAGLGVRSIDPSYISQDTKTPFAAIQAMEVGAAYEAKTDTVDANVRAVLFRTHVDRDLIFSESAGRNVLGAGSTRNGAALSGRATGAFFDAAGSVTLVESTFDDTGDLIPYVPDLVIRTDTTLFGPIWAKLRGTLGLGVTYVGRRALPFGQRSDAVFTIDSLASLNWDRYTVGVTVQNLLDWQYRLGEYNYASDFRLGGELPSLVPTRHFTAGAPRTVLFTLEVTL